MAKQTNERTKLSDNQEMQPHPSSCTEQKPDPSLAAQSVDQQLRRSEERFQRLFMAAAVGIVVTDSRRRILQANQSYCRLLGYRADELHEIDFLTLTHPDDRAVNAAQHERLLAGELESFVVEKRLIGKDGRVVWVRVSVSLVRDDDANPLHVLAVVEDNTQQHTAEERLKESESLLRVAAQVGRLGGWKVELPAFKVTWSDGVRAIHEVAPDYTPSIDEAIYFYAPEHRELISQAVNECINAGKSFSEELQIITGKGRRVWVRAIGEAVQDEDGTVVQIHGAFQDISARKEAEKQIQQSQSRFRQLADSMPLIVWTAEPDGTVDYANKAFADYAGVGEDELPRQAWVRTLHPDDVDRCLTAWAQATRTERLYEIEFRICRHSDSSYRWHAVRAVPIRDEAGKVIKWYGSGIDIHDSKLIEEKASRLAQRLTTTLESLTDAFFTLDKDWRITYLNREAERLMGRKREDILGKVVWDEFPGSDKSNYFHEYNRARRENVAVKFEVHMSEPERWLDVRAYPSEEGLAIYFQDVTERKQSERSLRQSEERFRLLSRATNDAIWDWDLVADKLWWNEGIETLFGYRHDDMETDIRSWADHLHPDDKERVVGVIRKTLEQGGTHWQEEYRFIRKDRAVAYVLDRGFVIRNEAGEAVRMVGGMSDQTAQKQNERRLQEQAALLDKAPNAILVQDLQNQITFWNQGAERLYGWASAEAVGRSVIHLLYKDPVRFYQISEKVIAQGEWSGELEHKNRAGHQILIEGRWSLVRDDEGNPHSILAIHTDITERKKLEAQFLRAQRLESIGTLAGGIAHDLNNVLTPIMLSIPLLKRGVQSERDLRRVDMLEENIKRGAEMVRQVLTFARGAEGQRERVDVRQIVQDVMKLMQDTLGKNINMILDVPDKVWVVEGDSTQIHQVLVNLCVNARDAMPVGGELIISVDNLHLDEQYASMDPEAQPGPYVRLMVADTGMGIPKEIRDRIFDPFFTTKETGSGTGLGLSTVRGIVKGHRGLINVYSEEGQGTVFKIYFPALASESGQIGPPKPEELPRGNGELILVVDDEVAVRTITEQTLEAFGYQVLLAEDGAEALSIFVQHRERIAAVLTDMMMPVMDGIATIQALHRIDPSVKIVAASGLAANGMVAKAAGAGVKNFLAKPYTAEALLTMLEQILT